MNRLIIVDDHPVVVEGMARLIEGEPGIEFCGSAGSVKEGLDLVEELKPDLVLADMTLPDRSGLALIKELKLKHPDIPILAISMHDEKIYAERVISAGGSGYIMKGAASGRLVEAIHCVLRGEIYLSSTVSQHLSDNDAGRNKAVSASPIKQLTNREFEIFQQIGMGKKVREIGELLHISLRTVHAHRANIRKKLDLKDGNELAQFAVKWLHTNNNNRNSTA